MFRCHVLRRETLCCEGISLDPLKLWGHTSSCHVDVLSVRRIFCAYASFGPVPNLKLPTARAGTCSRKLHLARVGRSRNLPKSLFTRSLPYNTFLAAAPPRRSVWYGDGLNHSAAEAYRTNRCMGGSNRFGFIRERHAGTSAQQGKASVARQTSRVPGANAATRKFVPPELGLHTECLECGSKCVHGGTGSIKVQFVYVHVEL